MKPLALHILSSIRRTFRRTFLARISVLNRIHAALTQRFYNSREVHIEGFHVVINPCDRFIGKKLILYGGYEKQEIAVLCSFVNPGDHVLDIGANIGLHTLHLSRAVGPTGVVLAVEPDPGNYALLETNLERNGCENVIRLPSAFGAETGEVDLFRVEENCGSSSLVAFFGTGQSVRVPIQRGEKVIAELKLRPKVAKIDVEGAEPFVLSGLGKYKPGILFFEFAPELLRAQGHNPEAFLDSLVTEGYTLEPIDPDSGKHTRSTPSEIMALAEKPNDLNILSLRQ